MPAPPPSEPNDEDLAAILGRSARKTEASAPPASAAPPPQPPPAAAQPYYAQPVARPAVPNARRTTALVVGVVGVSVAALIALIIAASRPLASKTSYYEHQRRGNAAYEARRYQDAAREYSAVIALRPNDRVGYSSRGTAEYAQGEYRQAAQDYRQAAFLNHSGTESLARDYRHLGYAEYHLGDYEQAIRAFSAAIRQDGSIPDRRGNTANADDRTQDAHKGRLWAFYAAGRYEEALQDCNALLKRHAYPENYAVRARIEAHQGRDAEARSDYQTAIQLNPTQQWVWQEEEQWRIRKGDGAGSVQIAQADAQRFPGDANVIGSLGWVQYEAGQIPQSVVTDQQALRIQPDMAWVQLNLGLSEAVLGQTDASKAAYASALKHASSEDVEGGRQDILDALKRHPNSPPLRAALAMLQKAGS